MARSKKKTPSKKMSAEQAYKKVLVLWGDAAFVHSETRIDANGGHTVCAVGHGKHRWTAATFEGAIGAGSAHQ